MLLLALALFQQVSGELPVPARETEQHADLALRRAGEGRDLALRFLCADPSRLLRLNELNDRLSQMRRLFVVRFGHPWREYLDAQSDPDTRKDELGRRDDCRLRDGFAAGMTDYENGLLAAQAVFVTTTE